MYMRYAGGGVGHYKLELDDSHDSTASMMDDEPDSEEPIDPVIGDDGDNLSDTSTGSESESELQDDDENLPEDGEGGFVDAEDDEGYAVL